MSWASPASLVETDVTNYPGNNSHIWLVTRVPTNGIFVPAPSVNISFQCYGVVSLSADRPQDEVYRMRSLPGEPTKGGVQSTNCRERNRFRPDVLH
jgi:hypothetical protein